MLYPGPLAKDLGLVPEPGFRGWLRRIVKRAIHAKRENELLTIARAEFVGPEGRFCSKPTSRNQFLLPSGQCGRRLSRKAAAP